MKLLLLVLYIAIIVLLAPVIAETAIDCFHQLKEMLSGQHE